MGNWKNPVVLEGTLNNSIPGIFPYAKSKCDFDLRFMDQEVSLMAGRSRPICVDLRSLAAKKLPRDQPN